MIKKIDGHNMYYNYVGNNWLYTNDEKMEVFSPVDGSFLGYLQKMNTKDIDFAFAQARKASKVWEYLPASERAEYLYKTASILEERAEEIAKVMMYEIAKDYKSCLSEVTRTADYIRFSADTAKTISGEGIPGDLFPGYKQDKWSIVKRVPLGVVLAISPFNYPINLSASKIAPALVMGNTVVLKPATQGAMSALHLVKAFVDAGLPEGVLNTITGKGNEIGDYVTDHIEVDFINFTGSSRVGKDIAKKVAMKPLLMELGGKDAAIVLEDADLDLAASNIVAGAYSYSGQRCTAVKRILVIESVADKLVEKLVPLVQNLKVGNPEDNATITPLIDEKSANYVMELVDEALDRGAKPIVKGKQEGNLIYPYLLDNVDVNMRLAWEEPFGPVLPIIRVKDVDEAIEFANKSEYGLQSSVFSNNIDHAFYVAKRLEVGSVQINNKTERGPDHFPFIGVKSSGIGAQGIRYSIEAMSRLKATILNTKDEYK
ncbi:NADP-dependent glyceraldehyde-3-phosphate dehydrogenase [Breznakia pachnodae]|uniref:Glyceraldehyde-3-phosphate dehydrogenase (NADP+) n=1 Tax=Breznakia pachnodae TaxID=265178 RepID=A0ABU0E165_9FIRM|nr:NADP-dependent glyceraldehyde-3-phosphate dehydrogenase [Breznakia pachnodae]MDQ0360473.1 glyceraldehyde-3-phosphate dehydrogenase (NADP+) [Breznakia pachnodae]